MNTTHAHSNGAWRPLMLCGALLASWCASAQQAPVPPDPQELQPPPSEPAAPVAIEDAKLDKFAEAFVVVESIQRETLEQLENETDAQKAAQLKSQAESKAIAAVEKVGMPLMEFNQIAQQMMTDLALREKVAERVAQRRAPAATGPAS